MLVKPDLYPVIRSSLGGNEEESFVISLKAHALNATRVTVLHGADKDRKYTLIVRIEIVAAEKLCPGKVERLFVFKSNAVQNSLFGLQRSCEAAILKEACFLVSQLGDATRVK